VLTVGLIETIMNRRAVLESVRTFCNNDGEFCENFRWNSFKTTYPGENAPELCVYLKVFSFYRVRFVFRH